MATLDPGDYTLAGHSIGGMIAAEIAAHVPGHAARLALVAPLGLWNEQAPVADIFALPGADQLAALWHDKAQAEAWTAANDPGEDPARLEAVMVASAQASTAVAKYIWPIPDKGLRKRMHRITVPTTLVWGAADQIVPPSYAQDFAAALAKPRIHVIADAGHMVPQEQPQAVAQAICE